jgi:hypothetical protein
MTNPPKRKVETKIPPAPKISLKITMDSSPDRMEVITDEKTGLFSGVPRMKAPNL